MTWRDIGKLRRVKGRWQIYCAGCGRGMACSVLAPRAQIANSLKKDGWTCDKHQRWRCPKCPVIKEVIEKLFQIIQTKPL